MTDLALLSEAASRELTNLLVRTSRTFAIPVQMLPEPERTEMTAGYLLFRIADSLEDAGHWPHSRKLTALTEFKDLLPEGPRANTRGRREAADCWVSDRPCDHRGYLDLLKAVPLVLSSLDHVASHRRNAIVGHLVRTIDGMADFIGRTPEGGILQVRDVADLKHYCYVVAGIVGEMITDLFLLDRPECAGIEPILRERAIAFGEGLQLVNILKDHTGDLEEGRSYIPAGVDIKEIFRIARADLVSATEYVHAIQSVPGTSGLVAFCALPVAFAVASLDHLEKSAVAGSKISRARVAQIVFKVTRAIQNGRPALQGVNGDAWTRVRSTYSLPLVTPFGHTGFR